MFDPSVELTDAERELVNSNYLTVPAVRFYWSKFPDLTLEALIGDLKELEKHLAEGKETASVPELGKQAVAPSAE